MSNLLLLLLFIFGGVALIAVLARRFGGPADPQRTARLARWIYPLVGVLLLLTVLDYYLF